MDWQLWDVTLPNRKFCTLQKAPVFLQMVWGQAFDDIKAGPAARWKRRLMSGTGGYSFGAPANLVPIIIKLGLATSFPVHCPLTGFAMSYKWRCKIIAPCAGHLQLINWLSGSRISDLFAGEVFPPQLWPSSPTVMALGCGIPSYFFYNGLKLYQNYFWWYRQYDKVTRKDFNLLKAELSLFRWNYR